MARVRQAYAHIVRSTRNEMLNRIAAAIRQHAESEDALAGRIAVFRTRLAGSRDDVAIDLNR